MITLSIMMFVAVLVIIWRVMPAARILTRINSDFSLNIGFIAPENLQKETWTTLQQTSYENGAVTAQNVFKQNYFGYYTICHQPVGSDSVVLLGKSIDSTNWEYLGDKTENSLNWIYFEQKTEEDLCFSSYYGNDMDYRIDRMGFNSRDAYRDPGITLKGLRFEYSGDNAGQITRQSKSDGEGVMNGYRTMVYDGDRLSKTMDYDTDDVLTGYTDYVYDGKTCMATSYDSDNSITGTTETMYNLFGQVKTREHYDAEGNLISREVYHYRFWEGLNSPYGLLCVLFLLSFSLWISLQVSIDKFVKLLRRHDEREISKY